MFKLLLVLFFFLTTPIFGEEHAATVLKVTDGDTMLVRFELGLDVNVTGKVRLAGLDCPELKTEEGKRVRDEMKTLLEGTLVKIDVHGKEKYGRWLGTVYVGPKNINEWLIKTGRAKAYDGGKR